MPRHAARLGLAILVSLVAIDRAHADLYRWTDDAGVTHYAPDAGRVPRAFRGSAVLVNDTPVSRPARFEPAAPAAQVTPEAEPVPTAPAVLAHPPKPELPPIEQGPPAQLVPQDPLEAQPPPETTRTTPALPAVEPPTKSGGDHETAVRMPRLPPIEQGPPVPATPPDPLAPSPAAQLPEAERTVAPAIELPTDIAELQRLIEADREELRELIGEARWEGTALANDSRLRELADRLPRLQAQLDALRGEAPR